MKLNYFKSFKVPFLLGFFLTGLVFGCSTSPLVKMYSGDELPIEKIAIIKESDRYLYLLLIKLSATAVIVEVDGEKVEHFYDKAFPNVPGVSGVKVIPGFHELLVLIGKAPGGGLVLVETYSIYLSFVRLSFYADAGHEYKLAVPLWWKKGSLVALINTSSDTQVASKTIGGKTYALSELAGHKFPNGYWSKSEFELKQLNEDCRDCMKRSWEITDTIYPIPVDTNVMWLGQWRFPDMAKAFSNALRMCRHFQVEYIWCMETKGYSWQESPQGMPLGVDSETYLME